MRWLKWGDASTKYFFNQLRAKQERESIKCLEQLEDGEIMKDENRIMQAIFDFYTDLFKLGPEVVGRTVERNQVLNLITKKILKEENTQMIEPPTDLEIEHVVQAMKKEKSPGIIDKVTSKMLQKFWPCMKDACCELVKIF